MRNRSSGSLPLLGGARKSSSWSSYDLLRSLDAMQQQQQQHQFQGQIGSTAFNVRPGASLQASQAAAFAAAAVQQQQQQQQQQHQQQQQQQQYPQQTHQGLVPSLLRNDGTRLSTSPPPSIQLQTQLPNYVTGGVAGDSAGPHFFGAFDALTNIPVHSTGGGGTMYQSPLLHGYVQQPFVRSTQQQSGFSPISPTQQQQQLGGYQLSGVGGRGGTAPLISGRRDQHQRVGGIRTKQGGSRLDISLKHPHTSSDDEDASIRSIGDTSEDNSDELKSGIVSNEDDVMSEEAIDFETWVRYHHGATPIKKLLIANNGISAVKSIRCMRQWLYETFGDSNIIHFVVMATPEDTASNAEYIRLADEVVPVPGGANNYNYANVPLVVNIAKQTKCDAVWPGWGHASENPALPRTLKENGILWVGPDADSMYASGDKIMSTLIAQSAGVPCIPWYV